MTYDAKAEAERLLEPFSVEYVEYDPDKMGDEHPRDAIRNAIAAALTAARESMREEAARLAEYAEGLPEQAKLTAAAIRSTKAPKKEHRP
jgi:hypothetical protein